MMWWWTIIFTSTFSTDTKNKSCYFVTWNIFDICKTWHECKIKKKSECYLLPVKKVEWLNEQNNFFCFLQKLKAFGIRAPSTCITLFYLKDTLLSQLCFKSHYLRPFLDGKFQQHTGMISTTVIIDRGMWSMDITRCNFKTKKGPLFSAKKKISINKSDKGDMDR